MQGQICFGKLNSCFDNSCYKKFADNKGVQQSHALSQNSEATDM